MSVSKSRTVGLVSYICNVIALFSFIAFVFALFGENAARGTAVVGGRDAPHLAGLDFHLDSNVWTFYTDTALPWWLDVLSRIDAATPFLCWTIGGYVLGEVVRSVQAGDPFDVHNPRRIVTLAGLVAIGGTGMGVLHYLVSALLLDQVEIPPRVSVGAHFDAAPLSLLIAGALLTVAAAFRQGRRLTQDVEGLV